MAKAGKGLLEGTLQAGTSAVSDKLLDLVGLGGKSAADKGKDTRDYLAAAFPELNAWERAGADASSAGMVDAGFENQKELTKMQLDNQKEIAEMQNETQKEIAGIQSATSRQNTKDQVYAQNEMLAYQQKESTARVASIMEKTNLSKQQQVSEIMRQMLTQAQTAGQYFTNDQFKEMTRKVSAEVDLVYQQTQNQRYGSSCIGANAKDIINVVTDCDFGADEADPGIKRVRMPLDLGYSQARLGSACRVIAEVGVVPTHLVRRSPDRTLEQIADPVLQHRVGGQTDRILDPLGFEVLVDARHRESGIGPEIDARDFAQVADHDRTEHTQPAIRTVTNA